MEAPVERHADAVRERVVLAHPVEEPRREAVFAILQDVDPPVQKVVEPHPRQRQHHRRLFAWEFEVDPLRALGEARFGGEFQRLAGPFGAAEQNFQAFFRLGRSAVAAERRRDPVFVQHAEVEVAHLLRSDLAQRRHAAVPVPAVGVFPEERGERALHRRVERGAFAAAAVFDQVFAFALEFGLAETRAAQRLAEQLDRLAEIPARGRERDADRVEPRKDAEFRSAAFEFFPELRLRPAARPGGEPRRAHRRGAGGVLEERAARQRQRQPRQLDLAVRSVQEMRSDPVQFRHAFFRPAASGALRFRVLAHHRDIVAVHEFRRFAHVVDGQRREPRDAVVALLRRFAAEHRSADVEGDRPQVVGLPQELRILLHPLALDGGAVEVAVFDLLQFLEEAFFELFELGGDRRRADFAQIGVADRKTARPHVLREVFLQLEFAHETRAFAHPQSPEEQFRRVEKFSVVRYPHRERQPRQRVREDDLARARRARRRIERQHRLREISALPAAAVFFQRFRRRRGIEAAGQHPEAPFRGVPPLVVFFQHVAPALGDQLGVAADRVAQRMVRKDGLEHFVHQPVADAVARHRAFAQYHLFFQCEFRLRELRGAHHGGDEFQRLRKMLRRDVDVDHREFRSGAGVDRPAEPAHRIRRALSGVSRAPLKEHVLEEVRDAVPQKLLLVHAAGADVALHFDRAAGARQKIRRHVVVEGAADGLRIKIHLVLSRKFLDPSARYSTVRAVCVAPPSRKPILLPSARKRPAAKSSAARGSTM